MQQSASQRKADPSPHKEGSSLGPGEIFFLFKREHRIDEARGSLAICATFSHSASEVSACNQSGVVPQLDEEDPQSGALPRA